MLTEQAVVEKIEKIIEDNSELLRRDLTITGESPETRIERSLVILRLIELYEVIEKPKPIFKCEREHYLHANI